jgi:hypothetical protein
MSCCGFGEQVEAGVPRSVESCRMESFDELAGVPFLEVWVLRLVASFD